MWGKLQGWDKKNRGKFIGSIPLKIKEAIKTVSFIERQLSQENEDLVDGNML